MTEQISLLQQGETATLQEHQAALHILLKEFDRVCRQLNISYFLFAGTLLGAARSGGIIPWDDDLDVIMERSEYDRFCREAPSVIDPQFYVQAEYSDHWPMFFSKLRLNGTTCLERAPLKDLKTHTGVYMDIFPLDHAWDSALGQKLQFFCSKLVIAKGLYRRGYQTDSALKKAAMVLPQPIPRKLLTRVVHGPKKPTAHVHCFLGGASKMSHSLFPAEYFSRQTQLPFDGGQYPAPAEYDKLLTALYGDWRTPHTPEQRACKRHTALVDLKNPQSHYTEYLKTMKIEGSVRSIR